MSASGRTFRDDVIGVAIYRDGTHVLLRRTEPRRVSNPRGGERGPRGMGRAHWFDLVVGARGSRRAFHPGLRKAHGASGVYALRDRASKSVIYVGESHKGRLYKTLIRHFGDPSGQFARRGEWTHLAPERLEVAIWLCKPSSAVQLECEAIRHYDPQANRARCDSDAAPF